MSSWRSKTCSGRS